MSGQLNGRTPGSSDGEGPQNRPLGATGSPKSPGDEVPPGTSQTGEDVCPRCKGSGQVEGKTCPDCEGSGTVIVNVGDA